MPVQHVARGFARSASRYDAHAEAQILCANRLAAYMEAGTRDLIEGPVLEVGCGTGLQSRRLVELFRDRQMELTDISQEMLDCCRERVEGAKDDHRYHARAISQGTFAPGQISYDIIDVREFRPSKEYALITAAFVLQWIDQLDAVLAILAGALKPGGKLFFSVPTAGSFPEWKAISNRAGVCFTGNHLPEVDAFRTFARDTGMTLGVYEETFKVNHPSMEHFLSCLKSVGAGTSLTTAQLRISETKRLLDTARGQDPHSFTATYKVLFGHLTKRK